MFVYLIGVGLVLLACLPNPHHPVKTINCKLSEEVFYRQGKYSFENFIHRLDTHHFQIFHLSCFYPIFFSRFGLFDQHRLTESIQLAPIGKLAVVTDQFNRVLLVNTSTGIIIRIWKGLSMSVLLKRPYFLLILKDFIKICEMF